MADYWHCSILCSTVWYQAGRGMGNPRDSEFLPAVGWSGEVEM